MFYCALNTRVCFSLFLYDSSPARLTLHVRMEVLVQIKRDQLLYKSLQSLKGISGFRRPTSHKLGTTACTN